MVNNRVMEVIQFYMDDEIREELHNKYAPCSNDYFLKKYCEEDTEFVSLLLDEFGIDIDDLEANVSRETMKGE